MGGKLLKVQLKIKKKLRRILSNKYLVQRKVIKVIVLSIKLKVL